MAKTIIQRIVKMRFDKNSCISILFILISKFDLSFLNPELTNIQYQELYFDNHNINKREILIYDYKWKFPIKYFVKPPVSVENVKKAIEYLEKNTCVRFKQLHSIFSDDKGLIFENGDICISNIGQVFESQPQTIKLSKYCYDRPIIILHEIGHALGLVHEHNRRDRDNYIKIDKDNIIGNKISNFVTKDTFTLKSFLTTYDHASIMHYNPYIFAKNRKRPVINSKLHSLYLQMIGQELKMTFNDFKKINLYHCDKCKWVNYKTDSKVPDSFTDAKCLNDGYPNFNNCSTCICPSGYTGDLCNKIMPSDAECGDTDFTARTEYLSLVFVGRKTCYIQLLAGAGKKIRVFIHYVNALRKGEFCTDDHGYEVKYLNDKGTTGLLLCGQIRENVELLSESNTVLIIFKGDSGWSFLSLSFREEG